jgi:prophage regulatory protein
MSQIVRSKLVCKMTGLSRSTIYELIAAGNFPRQVRLGSRSVGWRLAEVEEWIEKRPTGANAKVSDKFNTRLPQGGRK